jgi:hypothetical protein
VNGGVNQHRSSDCHDCLDVALGNPVVMMGADTSEECFLIKLEDVFGKGLRCEVGTVVEKVLLGDHSGVSTHELERLLRLKSLRGAESCLQLDMDVAGGRINENTASLVHLGLFGLAFAGEQTASSRTNEVIDRDPLSGEQLVLSKSVHAVSYNRSSDSRGRSLLLLGELTGCAHGRIDESSARRVEPSCALRGRQNSGSHQELDTTEG